MKINALKKNSLLLKLCYLFVIIVTFDMFFMPDGYPVVELIILIFKSIIAIVWFIILFVPTMNKGQDQVAKRDQKFYDWMFGIFLIVLIAVMTINNLMGHLPTILGYLYWLFLGAFISSSLMLDLRD